MAKLVNFCISFFTFLFYPQIVHQGLNKESGPFGHQSWDTARWRKQGRQRVRYFYCCRTGVRPHLAPSALTPDHEVWESKEQRHLRQMDTSHHNPGSNLVMLTRSCAPAKESSQELGNQSSLTCRQWLANSAMKCTQRGAALGLRASAHSVLWGWNGIPALCMSS